MPKTDLLYCGAEASEQIRTHLYGDQWLFPEELQVLHTRTFQRLYDIKQLGWADRVYPDAVHSRFNHCLGTLEQVSRIAFWTLRSCRRGESSVPASEIQRNMRVIRLAALLHDVFHIPFGHTLEDELRVFPERHDQDEGRKLHFLNRLLAEVIFWLWDDTVGTHRIGGASASDFWDAFHGDKDLYPFVEARYSGIKDVPSLFSSSQLTMADFVAVFAKAAEVLLYMGGGKMYQLGELELPWSEQPPLAHRLISHESKPLFSPERESYICDMVGNTISADLLDYAHRDSLLSGLRLEYDDRVLQHFTIVCKSEDIVVARKNSNGDWESYKRQAQCRRLALKLVKHRIRYDVLSEILQILRIRYLLSERVLYHRTKCAASAMLATAIGLLDLKKPERDAILHLGDCELMRFLDGLAARSDRGVSSEKTGGATRLLRALRARRFYKPVFHVKSLGIEPTEDRHPAQMLKCPDFRAEVEREMESTLGLEPGTVCIYCPAKGPLKQAECLVVYGSGNEIAAFKDVPQYGELGSFIEEGEAVLKSYRVLWNLYIFVPERLTIARVAIEELFKICFEKNVKSKGRSPTDFVEMENDMYLRAYLEGNWVDKGGEECLKLIAQRRDEGRLESVFQALREVERTRHQFQQQLPGQETAAELWPKPLLEALQIS